MYLASPTDFSGADDIITNLAKEREPGIQIIECTPLSLIITSLFSFWKGKTYNSNWKKFLLSKCKCEMIKVK